MSDIIKVPNNIEEERIHKIYDIFMKEHFNKILVSDKTQELGYYLYDGEPLYDDISILSKSLIFEQTTIEDMNRFNYLIKNRPILSKTIINITKSLRKIENIHNPTINDIIYNRDVIRPENQPMNDYLKSHKIHASINYIIELKKAYKNIFR